MTEENKLYLKNVFKIDVDKYSDDELGKLLDKIIIYLKDEINKLEDENRKLKQEIFLASEDGEL